MARMTGMTGMTGMTSMLPTPPMPSMPSMPDASAAPSVPTTRRRQPGAHESARDRASASVHSHSHSRSRSRSSGRLVPSHRCSTQASTRASLRDAALLRARRRSRASQWPAAGATGHEAGAARSRAGRRPRPTSRWRCAPLTDGWRGHRLPRRIPLRIPFGIPFRIPSGIPLGIPPDRRTATLQPHAPAPGQSVERQIDQRAGQESLLPTPPPTPPNAALPPGSASPRRRWPPRSGSGLLDGLAGGLAGRPLDRPLDRPLGLELRRSPSPRSEVGSLRRP
jgi:hypothetical protein